MKPLIGEETEPIAELTKLSWFNMSPGFEIELRTALLTQTYQDDYQHLCELDVLGIADSDIISKLSTIYLRNS